MGIPRGPAWADFHNHRILPFVGRESELDALHHFWRFAFDATRLRAMLITGEAGMGKTSLLARASDAGLGAHGCVVRVRLFSDSSVSLLELVVHALRDAVVVSGMFSQNEVRTFAAVQPRLDAVVGALRRLASLRPTLLIVEDLHLLAAADLHEFARLLDMLASEPLSLLAAARMLDRGVRGVLEPYFVGPEELMLRGLSQAECAWVMEQVCGIVPEPDVAAVLHEATAGNPVALGSAIHGVLRALDDSSARNPYDSDRTKPVELLVRTLQQSVGLLAEGMTAHLDPDELDAARRLASLGEMFSKEAAEIMVDDVERHLRALRFRGVVVMVAAPPSALCGDASGTSAFAFTNALLHRHLLESTEFDPERLVRAVADAPLYSVLPFRLLDERTWRTPSLDAESIARAFDRAMIANVALSHSAQWPLAVHTWTTAAKLARSRRGVWEPHDWERMLVWLLHHKLNLLRREPMAERLRWLRRLDCLTRNPASDKLCVGRFHVLFHRELTLCSEQPDLRGISWSEAEQLIAERPHLRYSFAYTDYVIAACVGASANGDMEMLQVIAQRVDQVLGSAELSDPVRQSFERKVTPPLLKLYGTADELRARLAQAETLIESMNVPDVGALTFIFNLFADVGNIERLQAIAQRTYAALQDQGLLDLQAFFMARQQLVTAGIVDFFDSEGLPCQIVFEGLPPWRRSEFEQQFGLPLVDAALLRRESARAREFVERYGLREQDLSPARRMLLARDADHPRTALLAIFADGSTQDDPLVRAFLPLVRGADSEGAPATAAAADIAPLRELLRAPVLRLEDILTVLAVLAVPAIARGHELTVQGVGELRGDMAAAVEGALEWLSDSERRMLAFVRPLFEVGSEYLTTAATRTWQKRIKTLASDQVEREKAERAGKVRVSMLGTIAVCSADGRTWRLQGKRARVLLAVMVINEIQRFSIEPDEFSRLASGNENANIKQARQVVNTAVLRMRESVFHDFVVTKGDVPRLNYDVVEVDVIEAHRLLQRANAALRHRLPMNAKVAVMRVFEVIGQGMPFSSFSEQFTEAEEIPEVEDVRAAEEGAQSEDFTRAFIDAARSDFEALLRTTALKVGRALANEAAFDDAVDVLKPAEEAMQGDDELLDDLCEALVRAGRRAEAELVRRKRRGGNDE